MKKKRRWNPVTRCLRYDREKVAGACYRRAAEREAEGNPKEASYWQALGDSVSNGEENVKEVALLLLQEAEEELL